MFGALYDVTREYSGLGQFVRVAQVFMSHRRVIHFHTPVRTIMRLVAAVSRLFGVRVR